LDIDCVRLACHCGGTLSLQATVKGGVVDRMTDHTQYTGTHKERFDASGQGKGIAGREEVNAKEGYVQGYKEKGTYGNKAADKQE